MSDATPVAAEPPPVWTAHRAGIAFAGVLAGLLLVFVFWRNRLLAATNRRLAANAEKFRDLVEGAVPGVLIHRDYKPLFVNPAYARIFGYDDPAELLRQRSALDHVAPHERDRLKDYSEARFRGEQAPDVYTFQGIKRDGTPVWVENRARIIEWEGAPANQRTVIDITDRKLAEDELLRRSLQQAVLAEIGQHALADRNLAGFMSTAVMLTAKFLEADFCKVLELLPGGRELLLLTGVGWKPGVVGEATVSADKSSQVGYTLTQGEPVIVPDIALETRFEAPPILRDHGVVSSMSAVIGDSRTPYGVIAVHTRARRRFSEDDAMFLKTVAILLTAAVARRRAGSDLAHSETRLRGAIESLQEGFALYDADDRLVACNEQYRLLNPQAEGVMRRGGTFEEMLRINVLNGRLPDATGREERFIEERLRQHRDPKGPIVVGTDDGRAYLIKESRTEEGSTAVTLSDISELKRAEDALRESRETLRAVIDASPSGIILKNKEGRYLLVNKTYASWMNLKPEAIVDKTIFELMPESANAVMNAERPIYRTGEISTVEYRVAYRDGKTRDVISIKGPVHSKTGAIDAVCTVVTDVTEARRKDHALWEAQERFKIVVDNLPMGVSLKDREGRFVLVNRCYQEWWGKTREEITGKLSEEVVPTTDRIFRARQAHEREVLAHKRVVAREERVRRADGTLHDLDITKFPVLGVDGEVELIGTITADITDRQRAERKFQLLLQSAPDAMILVDGEGRINLINHQVEALFGYTAEELIGKKVECLLPQDVAERHVGQRTQYHAAPRVRPMGSERELRARRKDGSEFPVEISLGPIADGDQMLVAAAVRDISERKRTERRLSDLQSELAHVLRVSTMSEMAAGLAHELNQPLAAITNYARGTLRRLRSGRGQPPDILSVMDLIAAQALRAGSIIRKMRGFMRRSGPQITAIDLWIVIDEVVPLFSGEMRIESVDIVVDVPQSLPPVLADSVQIQQVLLNLIRNAVAAMQAAGEGRHRLEIGAKKNPDDTVEVYVKDNGPGIAPELADKLFDPFFTTKVEGLGMGLSISRSIIANHEGRMWVTSTPGKGATFHFTLPIEPGNQ